MTPADFVDWRKRLGYVQDEAAGILGLSRRTIVSYERGEVAVPRSVELACEAVERRSPKKRKELLNQPTAQDSP